MLTNLKKNMGKLFVLLAVAMFLSGTMAASALAAEFTNAPEMYAPEWTESSPYQRDIYWDFSTDPTSNAATEYAGYLDDLLKVSDYVTFTGDVGWSMDSRIGVSGGKKSGTAIFHLDNLIDDRPVKHIWIESNQLINKTGSISISVNTQDGHTVTDQWNSGINDWYKIEPNPDWEDIVFTFTTINGGDAYAYLDELHIATESVPIPGALLLMGSGLVCLVGVGRKKIFGRG